MPRRKTSESRYLDLGDRDPDGVIRLTHKHGSAKGIADDAVRRAVAAWQSARRVHVAPKRMTGRADTENDRRRASALRAIDQIIRSHAAPVEQQALRAAASPLMATAQTIYAALTRGPHRPVLRRDGYQILANCVRTLMRDAAVVAESDARDRERARRTGKRHRQSASVKLALSLRDENPAVRFVVARLLALYPPEKNEPWLYHLEPHQAEDAQATLENRLSTFLHPRSRKKSPHARR